MYTLWRDAAASGGRWDPEAKTGGGGQSRHGGMQGTRYGETVGRKTGLLSQERVPIKNPQGG